MKRIALCISIALCVALAYGDWLFSASQKAQVWPDDFTFDSDTGRMSPNLDRAADNVGMVYHYIVGAASATVTTEAISVASKDEVSVQTFTTDADYEPTLTGALGAQVTLQVSAWNIDESTSIFVNIPIGSYSVTPTGVTETIETAGIYTYPLGGASQLLLAITGNSATQHIIVRTEP